MNLLYLYLQPLFIATKEMSTEKFTSLSKIIQIVRLLKAKCKKDNSTVAQHLLNYMNLYFAQVEEKLLLRASTYLDPRFKDLKMAEKAISEVLAAISETEDQPSYLESNNIGFISRIKSQSICE